MSSPNLDDTYGSALIGLVAGAVLYGVTILQTYLYFRRYPNDPFVVKFTVLFLSVLDTAHLVLCTITIYWVVITHFSDRDVLLETHWSLNLQTDCNGLIGLIVEVFFARRVWIMSRNWFLTAVIVVLAFVHFALGIVFTIEAFILGRVTEYRRLIWVTSAGLGSAAASDIIIAVSLCYYLMRRRTGFSRTDSLITTLIAYSLTTGLVTSVIASVCVVTFAIMPTNFIWLTFFWILGKCYVNSFLAALNSRDSLRERAAMKDGTFLHLTPFRATALSHAEPPSPVSMMNKPTPLAINVTVARETTVSARNGLPLDSENQLT